MELVMVIVIVAILSGIAVPRFSSSIAHHRAESAARRVATDLELAGRKAIASNAARTISFNTVNSTYQILNTQDINNPAKPYIVSLFEEPYNAKILSADFGGDGTVIFDIYGKPDSAGSVEVGVGQWKMTVSLDAGSGLAVVLE